MANSNNYIVPRVDTAYVTPSKRSLIYSTISRQCSIPSSHATLINSSIGV